MADHLLGFTHEVVPVTAKSTLVGGRITRE